MEATSSQYVFIFGKAHFPSASVQSTLSFTKSVFPLCFSPECIFLNRKRISNFRLLPYPPRDLFVMMFLQKSPWTSTLRIFLTTTPNKVIPKPTSSSRRARSVGTIFTMWQHSENDHFALALNHPPPRENILRWFFPRVSRTSSQWIPPPRQATPSICMIVMQCHGLNFLNLFKILL